jgi:hypothetical protein
LAAKGRQIETESAPIRYVAELLATDTDGERAIRWLIALMVLCCDPLAIALAAASTLTQIIHRETPRGPLAAGLPAPPAFRATQSLNTAC